MQHISSMRETRRRNSMSSFRRQPPRAAGGGPVLRQGTGKVSAAPGASRRGFVVPVLAVCLLLGGFAPMPVVFASDRPLVFLHALQEQGYGDMAVEYLKQLEKRPDVPPELRDVWDLEMSKSLRAAANDAFNAQEFEALNSEAQKYLGKFLKEQPNHPATASAMATWGGFAMDRALKSIRAAQDTADSDQKSKLLAEARASLQEARSRFKEAADKFRTRLAAVAVPSKRPAKRPNEREDESERDELEANVQNAYFQAALCDYYTAQTYPNPRDKTRRATLQTAAKEFDNIFQTNRLNAVGLCAHMWHGKATEELGDVQTALDIYDEVLVNEPEPALVKDAKMESLFAQVQRYRLQLLAKKSPQQSMSEALEWLRSYAKSKLTKATDGYQGIALDVAETQLAAAKRIADPRQRAKQISAALAILAEMAKVPSPHQQKAILLRLQYAKAGDEGAPETFDEAVALGETAATAGDWGQAAANYSRALELADAAKVKSPERIPAARDALANAIYMQGRHQFSKGQFAECVTTAGKVISTYGNSPAAPLAGSLAVAAAFSSYAAAAADEKPAALDRLQKVARVVIATWPAKPEADDARMALAQASLIEGKAEQALTEFAGVNEKSDRYPLALYWAARVYFDRYLAEKRKPADSQNKDQMTADREKAGKLLADSLEIQRKRIEPGRPVSRQLLATQLTLAELEIEGDQPQQAIALLQPLVEKAKLAKGEPIDSTTLGVFVGTLRAYAKLNDVQNAAKVGMLLAESGVDTKAVNAALLECVRMLDQERKQADAALAETLAGSDPQKLQPAQAKLAATKELLTKFLTEIVTRQQLSPAAMVFVADAAAGAGMDEMARQQYQNIARRFADDPEFAKAGGKSVARVRAQLVGMLAQQGNYEEALTQVKELVAENPHALEPLMEQGHILQILAEKDSSHLKEAVVHWNKLRDTLQRMPKRPPEYFEVTYNLASCLYRQAANAADKTTAGEKAKQGEQLLTSVSVLSPNLDGPQRVNDYKALLQKFAAIPGRTPANKAPAGKAAK